MTTDSNQYDVAIVGGGIAGIYTGWRLATSDPAASDMLSGWSRETGKLKIGVFEGSQRIGGRLLSAKAPGMDDTVCEIGGMRYVSSQTLVRSLIENKLNLNRHEQVVDVPSNIAHLRGKHLRNSQTADPSLLPFDLEWIEAEWLRANKDPSGLIGWAITRILPEVGKLNGKPLEEFLRTAEVDGVPLYHHGFWNLLARALSTEAYDLSRTLVGYDCLASNANAVDLTTCYFDFTPGVKYYLLDGGYETVPWILEEQFRDAGGSVQYGAWLDSFEPATLPDGTTGVALRFRDGRPTVTARSIVLAMPRHPLEKLSTATSVLETAKFQTMLSGVNPIPLYKLFLGYNYPWWENAGVSQGRSFTDMPLRQCYYWANNAKPSRNPNTTNSLVMIYDDATNVDFWGGLRMSPIKSAQKLRVHAASPAVFARKTEPAAALATTEGANPFEDRLRQNWREHEAPALLVKETHRQLMLMHDTQYAPDPVEAAYADWSDEPYGGAVHLWNRGYKSWVVVDDMTQPVEDFPCYICGEAYSTNQTWAEGALQTAEIVLQKRFGLPPAPWVTQEPETTTAPPSKLEGVKSAGA